MKIFISSLVFLLLLGSCSLYDLRPETLKESRENEAANRIKAQKLISESAKVHGWDSIEGATLTVTYQDTWPGFLMRTFFRPWPSTAVNFKHRFGTENLYTSEIQILDGKKAGEIWGLENKQAFKIIDGEKQYKKNSDIEFYLPAYQYFIEMGLWAQDIPEVTFVGEQKIKNVTYQIVFATWNSFNPQKEVDQYLLYFDKYTKRLGIVEYTLRDVMASGHGVNWFSDFREVDGLLLPFKQTITGGLEDENVIHEITINEATIK